MVPVLEKLFPRDEFPYRKIEVGPSEAEERLLRLVRSFMECIANSDRPLVLFIDDLQWSSAAEASVLAGLVSSFTARASWSPIRNCLVILCHRANELSKSTAEKIRESLDKLESKNDSGEQHGILEIALGPLQLADLENLIADALAIPRLENGRTTQNKRFFRLCDFVLKHTGGNPFFIETVNLYFSVFANFSS